MKKPAILLLTAAAGAFAVAGPGAASNEYKNKYGDTAATRDCGDGDKVVYGGPLKLWPPNHKMQNVSVTATDGDDGSGASENPNDDVTLEVNPSVTDDLTGGDGGPEHDPDWNGNLVASGTEGTATVNFSLRAERSGKGQGRTYTLDFTATFDGPTSKTCTSLGENATQEPFTVFVPHDMRGGANWK